jgi:hypothetical protein
LTGGVSAARSRLRTAARLGLAYDALCSLPLAVWFSFGVLRVAGPLFHSEEGKENSEEHH